MTTYNRGLDGKLNDILTILGTTKPSLWPFWEKTGLLVSGIGAGDLASAETAGAAEALEDDFSPLHKNSDRRLLIYSKEVLQCFEAL